MSENANDRKVSQLPILEVVTPDVVLYATINDQDFQVKVEQLVAGIDGSVVTPEQLALKADQTAVDALQTQVNELQIPSIEGLATTQALTQGLAGKADTAAVTAVSEAVALKADASVVTALQEQVAGIEIPDTSAFATTEQLQTLSTTVGGKAEQTDLVTLQETVAGLEAPDLSGYATTEAVAQGLAQKADASALADYATADSVAQSLAGKANVGALNALGGRVDSLEAVDPSLATKEEVTQGLALKANQADLESLSETVSQLQAGEGVDLSNYTTVATTAALAQRVTDVEAAVGNIPDVSGLATTEALTEGLALKANQDDLNATNASVADKASAADLTALQEQVAGLTPPDLSGYATTQALTDGLAGKANSEDLSNYTTTTELVDLLNPKANQTEVTEALALKADQSALDTLSETVAGLTPPDLSGYATTQSLTDGLGTKADREAFDQLSDTVAGLQAPDLSGYATTQALTDGLAGKADASALEEFVTSQALGTALSDYSTTAQQTQAIAEAVSDKALSADLTSLQDQVNGIQIPSVEGFISVIDEIVAGDVVMYVDGAWVSRNTKNGRMVYVGGQGTGALVADGSLLNPFVNIQDAINAIGPAAIGWVIQVLPRIAGGNFAAFTIPDGFTNLTIQGIGCTDAHTIRVDGATRIEGANTTRIRFKDMQFLATANDQVPVTFAGTAGRHYWDNITVERPSGSTADAVVFDGATANWHVFTTCNINGNVRLGGTPAASAALYLRGASAAGTDIRMDAAFTVALDNNVQIKHVQHDAGKLVIANTNGWVGTTGVAIDSTADATGLLAVSNSNLQSPLTGAYMKINKTGAAPYLLNNVNRSVHDDVLTGTRLTLTGSSTDLRADVLPANYSSTAEESVGVHLLAIDTRLGELADALAAVQPAGVILPEFSGEAVDATTEQITVAAHVLKSKGYFLSNVILIPEYRNFGTNDEFTAGPSASITVGTRDYTLVVPNVVPGAYEVRVRASDVLDEDFQVIVDIGEYVVTPA